MAELKFIVHDDFMKFLKDRLGIESDYEIITEALSHLNWAVDEAARGRLVLSANSEGKDVTRLGGVISNVKYDEVYAAWVDAGRPDPGYAEAPCPATKVTDGEPTQPEVNLSQGDQQ